MKRINDAHGITVHHVGAPKRVCQRLVLLGEQQYSLSISKSGQILEQGLFIESSLILPMSLPQDLLRKAFKAALASDPLM